MNLADLFTKALSHQKLNHPEHGLLKNLLGYGNMNEYREFLESILDIDATRAMMSRENLDAATWAMMLRDEY